MANETSKARRWVIQKQSVVEGEGGVDVVVWVDQVVPETVKITNGDKARAYLKKLEVGARYRAVQVSAEGVVGPRPSATNMLIEE